MIQLNPWMSPVRLIGSKFGNKALVNKPRAIEVLRQLKANSIAVWRLCNWLMMPKVDILVAGPANKNARPAPGETPLIKNTATSGVALEAQT